MSSRLLLLALLAALGAVLAWALLGPEGEAALPELERVTNGDLVAGSETPDELPPGMQSPTRRDVGSADLDEAALEDGDDELREDVFADGSILVEVEVLLPEGLLERTPHPFAGSKVVAQSWRDEDESTESHEAVIEVDGIARFRFDGWKHLDWFRADLPARFGLGPAFIEPHAEIEAGSLQRFAIRPSEGGRARGRVTTLDGSPLAGIEVCAWVDGDGEIEDRIGAWYPGHLSTVSGPTGWFEFESLPARDIFIAVRPEEWLQVRPDLNGSYDSRGYFELMPGEDYDVGTLRLTPRTTLSVTVEDVTGTPVRSAVVHLSPQSFRDARLLSEEAFEARLFPEDATEQEQALAREAAEFFAPWAFGDLQAVTDDDGRVELAAVPGAFDLTVVPRMCPWDQAYVRLVQLPQDELAVQLPFAVRDLRGTVVDATTQRSIGRATVRVTTDTGSVNARTDEEGMFLAEDIFLAVDYSLQVVHSDYFADEVRFSGRELAPRLEARRSFRIEAQVVDKDGKPVRGAGIQLQSVRLAPQVSGSAAALEWVAARERPLGEATTRKDGSFAFNHLWPGKYELELILPMETGEHGEWGEPFVEPGVWKRWTLAPSRARQRLEVDVSTLGPVEYVSYCSVIGTVVDAATNEPLVGVEVEVTRDGLARLFRTNDKGRYNYSLPAGKASTKIRHPGYETITRPDQPFGRGGQRPRWMMKRE